MNNKVVTVIVVIIVIVAAVAVAAYALTDSDDVDEIDNPETSIRVDTSLEVPEDTLLRVFGNVNGDAYIDESDMDLLVDIINGNAEQTYYADVNQDGYIDADDVTYLRGIMDGDDTRLYYHNYNYDTMSVAVPIDEMIVIYYQVLDAVALLGCFDRVVASDDFTITDKGDQYPGIENIINLGDKSTITAEDLMSAGPTTIITGVPTYHISQEVEDALPEGYDVVRLGNGAKGLGIVWHVVTLGYILGSDAAYEYLDFYNEVTGLLEDRLSVLDSDDVESGISVYFDDPSTFRVHNKTSGTYECIEMAGLYELAEGLYEIYGTYLYPDAEFWYSLEETERGLDRLIFAKTFETIGSNQQEFMDDFYEYMYLSGLHQLQSYQNGDAIAICYILTQSTQLMLGALVIASIVYPDLFEDIDVFDYLQEYYDDFTLMDFDVREDAFFFCTSQDLIDAGYDLSYSS